MAPASITLPPHKINRMGLSRSFQITSIFHRLSVFENLRCALLWSMRLSLFVLVAAVDPARRH